MHLPLFPSRSVVATVSALFWSNSNLFHFNLVWSSCSKLHRVLWNTRKGIQGRVIPLQNREVQITRLGAWEDVQDMTRVSASKEWGTCPQNLLQDEISVEAFGCVWVGNALRIAFPVVLSQAELQSFTTCFKIFNWTLKTSAQEKWFGFKCWDQA